MSDLNQQENQTIQETVVMMDQLPASDGPRAESPLYHVDLATITKDGAEEGGVILQEEALLGHLVVRGNVADETFKSGIQQVLGFEVPGTLKSRTKDGITMCWISPDEWLVILPNADSFKTEVALREALNGHFAIVNVSGGQTVINLSGDKVREVFKKSTPYDVDDVNFPVGKVVTSVFAKAQAVILRKNETEWNLVVRRSFADYIWLWLQDAAAEYGLVIKNT